MSARDELALEVFIADNSGQTREASLTDWRMLSTASTAYAHRIADGLLAAGYGKMPVEPVAWHHTPEPEGVQVVNDDTDNEGEDQNRWARTNNGTGWEGYKNGGSVYLDWAELERRWGPITW